MELLAMGEYGPFVWSAYLLTLFVIAVSVVQVRRRHRQITEQIRQGLRVEENGE